jgi:hypothetical protein
LTKAGVSFFERGVGTDNGTSILEAVAVRRRCGTWRIVEESRSMPPAVFENVLRTPGIGVSEKPRANGERDSKGERDAQA